MLKKTKIVTSLASMLLVAALIPLVSAEAPELKSELPAIELNSASYTKTVGDFTFTVDPSNNDVYLTEYNGSDATVIIPETVDGFAVTHIGDHVFDRNYTLSSITIPDTVEGIGFASFWNCYSLTTIDLPTNLKKIGAAAFQYCYGLSEQLVLPEGLIEIGYNAFYECTGITGDLLIPSSVDLICHGAFLFTGLKNVYFYGNMPLWEIGEISAVFHNTDDFTIHYPPNNKSWLAVIGGASKWTAPDGETYNVVPLFYSPTLTVTDEIVTADYSHICRNGDLLVLAFYEKGQYLRMTTAKASETTKMLSTTFSKGETIKAFMLDNNFVPLCKIEVFSEFKIQGSQYHIHMWQTDVGSTAALDYSVKQNSSFSYHLSSTVPNDVRVEYTVSAEPNTTYVVKVDCKTKNVVNHEESENPLGATISVGNYNNSASLSGTSDWDTLTVIGQSDADGNLVISMNLGYWGHTCTGEAWFENIRYFSPADYTAEDSTWKYLAVILTDTSISVPEESINLSYRMQSDEVDMLKGAMSRLENDLSTISGGLLNVDIDTLVWNNNFNHYRKMYDNNYYVDAIDAKTFCQENSIDYTKYDHVIFILCQPGLPSDYFGLGGTFISDLIGFSLVKFDSRDSLLYSMSTTSIWSSSVFVHEFLHSMESYSNVFGYEHATLHDAELYGYNGSDEWKAYYTDYIQKKIQYQGELIGIEPAVWKLPPRVASGYDD